MRSVLHVPGGDPSNWQLVSPWVAISSNADHCFNEVRSRRVRSWENVEALIKLIRLLRDPQRSSSACMMECVSGSSVSMLQRRTHISRGHHTQAGQTCVRRVFVALVAVMAMLSPRVHGVAVANAVRGTEGGVCAATSFPTNLSGTECWGLSGRATDKMGHPISTAAECLAACCDDATCTLWNYNPTPPDPPSCWVWTERSMPQPCRPVAGEWLHHLYALAPSNMHNTHLHTRTRTRTRSDPTSIDQLLCM